MSTTEPSDAAPEPVMVELVPEEQLEPRALLIAKRLGRRTFLGAALLALGSAGALWRSNQTYAGRVMPGVSVGAVDVGGLPEDDARRTLEAWADGVERTRLVFRYEGRTWRPSLGDLGIHVETEDALAEALGIGREHSASDRLRSLTGLVQAGRSVPVGVTLNLGTLAAWQDRVDEQLGRPPRDAGIEISGTMVLLHPEVDGLLVDRTRTEAIVREAARSLAALDIELPVVVNRATIRTEHLAQVHERASTALTKRIVVRHNRKRWKLEPEDLSRFLGVNVVESERGVESDLVVDEEALRAWLVEMIEPEVNLEPVDAVIAWDYGRSRVTDLVASTNGIRLKQKTLAAEVAASLLDDHADVEAPVRVVRPVIDSDRLDELGIHQQLAIGDSSYAGSNEGRATNIVVGSALLNGTLVPPGGSYSFNRSIGVIDYDRGFVDAAVIAGERIGRDVGGGICQVSTTVFRAALRAGFPIQEWWPHTYRLGFYELDGWAPGFDASIIQPEGDPYGGGDFRFVNPFDAWLLVESYTQDQRVYVAVFGPKRAYSAEITQPWISAPIPPPAKDLELVDVALPPGTVQLSEQAQSGLEVSYDRTVYDPDGNTISRDTWYTLFAARPNVWKVSPDMKGQSPAA